MVATSTARALLAMGALATALPALAAVLPDDRADALYHSYEGGGVQVTGPSVLVRTSDKKSISVFANYYVDSISSASIDVVTSGASRYAEERTEKSLGLDYLYGKTTLSLAYTNSEENDFSADSAHLGVSQSMFGDLTTVSLGYSRGWDEVRKNFDAGFEPQDVDRHHYQVGVSQVLTKNWLVDLGYENIADQGFLNNPYRFVRYLDPDAAAGWSREPEVYPRTHISNAVALRSRYFLPYRAAVHAEYRYYEDSWGITADTAEVGYTHPTKGGWIFDLRYRFYGQTRADFYSDLFDYQAAQNFRARDKELSTFTSRTLGVGMSYEFGRGGWGVIDRGTLNLYYDRIRFDYDDFRDARVTAAAPGEEPLYSFSADVLRVFISLWY